ncbi:MAG: (d)CMP kinase [Chloroflexi bacterium]|nr:(d)CMP kinase [Chloroflexota bacterium]
MPQASIIAIDGPAGSGKSALGESLAHRLGYLYFDTGVVYRAVTWVALQRDVDVHDEAAVTSIAESINIEVTRPTVDDSRQYTVLADGEDVTWQIFYREVDANVSPVSAHPRVRRALLALQQTIARRGRVVMVGRDIGTVVAPDADLKIFLNAAPEVRAHRRHLQALQRAQHADYQQILADLRRRDKIDSERQAAPLRPADDAVLLSTDSLTVDEEVGFICRLVDSRGG